MNQRKMATGFFLVIALVVGWGVVALLVNVVLHFVYKYW